jgi:sucrose-6-phosphate hydrolase SacC (GH32 family)
MVGVMAAAAAVVALASTAAASDVRATDPLAPAYHLTNGAGALGQLSGFVAQPTGDNEIVFHVFFARSEQPTWAHLTSTDLLTWTTATDAAAPTGAAGGSVFTIAPNVSPGVNSSVVAVALGAPTSAGNPVTAAVASEATLGTFTPIVDAAHCGGAGVICPIEQVSNAPLGAASGFQDAAAGTGSVAALVVSNNSDLVFFSSPDLISWTASAVPVIAAVPGGVASAELFTLQESQAAGQAVILWNSAGAARNVTLSVGGWDPTKLAFTETARHAGDFGTFSGAKTAVDGQGERVLLGEVAAARGALSLPRQVTVRADGSIGLRAHPSLWGVSIRVRSVRRAPCARFEWLS